MVAIPLMRPLALLAMTAFALAGCTDEAEPATTDAAAPASAAPFEPMVYSFDGSSYRIATFCFSDGGDFSEDVSGWNFTFESDRGLTYVVWQNSAGENHGTADQGDGKVPDGAVSFYVCNDITEPGPLFTAAYTLTVTQPEPKAEAAEPVPATPAGNETRAYL